ncbi:hypothetical protein GQ44DRAFT_740883 [Phaeosphaeriaceae sp. PMI808]|nr:hypothetical protein GQ44DRAFT_740883 [Phaeosphaeriaceae sp. PMI808]
MAEAAGPIEEVSYDDLCPICQLLLFAPVRTQCNHLLCASCMAQWADVSSTNQIEHSSLDVNLADFDPDYDPTYDLEANCPMCRTRTTASPDKALARQLEKKYSATYAERKVEEEIERGSRMGQDGIEGIMILVGNKHRLERGVEDANQHDWTFFVRTSRPDLIQKVRIYLHPTFRPPQVVLSTPPYEVNRLGWGIFTLEAKIVLKEPYKWIVDNGGARQSGLDLTWTLDFEGRGRQGRVRAKVKKFEMVSARELRALRSRTVPIPPVVDEDDDDDEGESSSDNEEEDEVSEYMEGTHR